MCSVLQHHQLGTDGATPGEIVFGSSDLDSKIALVQRLRSLFSSSAIYLISSRESLRVRLSIQLTRHFLHSCVSSQLMVSSSRPEHSQLVETCALLDQYTNYLQAHRILTQIVITGSRILGRAFTEAYKQAQASSKYAVAAAKDNPQALHNLSSSGLTLDEACKILNVKPPQGGKANMENVYERFKRLYDLNEPKQGGSFYLQSKILRARERIELEVREAERKAAMEKELKEGWKPKVYRD
jgi:mitochondrial import inner membrane translocase subunit TIM16